MATARTSKLISIAAVTAALALTPITAHATAKTASVAAKAPVTKFVVVKPWTSKGRLTVKATVERQSGSCTPSNLSGRRDAYRCFMDSGIVDPAFKSPTANSIAFRGGGKWHVYKNVTSFEKHAGTSPSKGQVFEITLTNGATCSMSTGAGPAPLPRFPYWAGLCDGGPYNRDGATWRATEDDGKNSNYPLLALNSRRTKWAAAVEYPENTVKFEPVRIAYR